MDSIERLKIKELFIFLLLLYPFIFLMGFYVKSIDVNQEFTLNIHIPNTFNFSFYDLDNETIIYQSNYSIYLIMVSGEEMDNYPIHHVNHFIDSMLLAYFLDVSLYNLSFVYDEYLLNGRICSWNFEYNNSNQYFGIGAFDLSLFNSTKHYPFFDFGNEIFLNLTLNMEANVYLHEISCFKEYDNIYRPFLNFTYNNQLYLEKHAWNITIPF